MTASIKDFLAGDIELSSPPAIFMRVSQALDDENNNAADIAAIIQQDPALSARMLKIVNSAFFGFPATVKSIDHAITIMGGSEIRLLVMSTSVVDQFSNIPHTTFDMDAFWTHSLETALFAKHLANEHPKKRQLSSAFVSGLLHDIGRLIMYSKAPDLARAAALLAEAKSGSELEAEKSTFGFNHAEVGGALLDLWKIPESIQSAAEFHHQPELANNHLEETLIIHLANRLSRSDTSSEQSTMLELPPEDPQWLQLGIPYRLLPLISNEVQQEFSITQQLFFGH
ncbi:MAG: HDOD domain-containing protein [Cycloclasticus sp.]